MFASPVLRAWGSRSHKVAKCSIIPLHFELQGRVQDFVELELGLEFSLRDLFCQRMSGRLEAFGLRILSQMHCTNFILG